MKFLAVAAVAVLAAIAEAKASFTNTAYNVEAGEPFTLTWAGNTGPVTITLKNGPEDDLKTVTVIDSDDSGNSFTWIPPATLASDTYAFEIDDGGVLNYSPQFTFEGTESASTSAASETETASASPSTSSETISETTSAPNSSTPISSTMSNSATASGNSSTTASSTGSSTESASKTSAPTSVISNTNDGQRYQSPLALVLVTVAALLYFN